MGQKNLKLVRSDKDDSLLQYSIFPRALKRNSELSLPPMAHSSTSEEVCLSLAPPPWTEPPPLSLSILLGAFWEGRQPSLTGGRRSEGSGGNVSDKLKQTQHNMLYTCVAVQCRNRILFHRVYQSCHCVQSVIIIIIIKHHETHQQRCKVLQH